MGLGDASFEYLFSESALNSPFKPALALHVMVSIGGQNRHDLFG